ncbi:hypothetical protein ACWCYZ_40785 [Streptomyces virginiae]
MASTASASAASSVDPQSAEKAAVLAAYAGMGAAEVRSYTSGTLDPEVERYTADMASADIKAALFWYQQRGTLMRGRPAHAPVIDSLDTTGDPRTVRSSPTAWTPPVTTRTATRPERPCQGRAATW